jgi:hypothetical protein
MSKPKQADGTCKTCKHFEEGYYINFGYCKITFPPWFKVSVDDTEVHRDASCDLYAAEATGEPQ